MLVLNNTDVIEGGAATNAVVEYTFHGLVGSVLTQLAAGVMGTTLTTALYTASDIVVVTSIILVNTHSAAVAVTLRLDPANAGNPRYIIPKGVSLGIGYSLHTDGVKITVMDASGGIVTSFNAHAVKHTNGTDDIQNATAAQKGVATVAQITKLDGIASNAIANLVEDATPQLGGDLDTNSKNINAINQTNAIENESKLLQTEDMFSDFVVTGLLPATSGTLISDISAGHAYVTGTRVNKAATSNTYTASVDTYVDINSAGAYTFPEVALGAGAPAVTADSIRLAKVVTSATAITGVTDLRTVGGSMTGLADGGIPVAKVATAVSTAANIPTNAIIVGDDGVKGAKKSVGVISDAGAMSGVVSITGLTTPLTKAQGGSGTTGDSIVKGWIQFNGTGVIAIQDSFNVTSITDNGTGDYTVTWDIDFAAANYAPIVCGNGYQNTIGTIAIGSMLTKIYTELTAAADASIITVIAIGDQA